VAAHAADDHERAAGTPQRGQRRGRGPEDAEDVGLELTAVIVERETLEGPTTPNPAFATATSTRPKASTAWPTARSSAPSCVTSQATTRARRPSARTAAKFLKPGHPASRQDQIRTLARELLRERRSDAGRGAGHQDDAVREAAHLPCAP
jgi:hypothetical protein